MVGYLWSLGVVAEIVVFALSNRLFRRWRTRDLLLLSGVCALVRWLLLVATIELPWLIVGQILHCGSFTVCHLAAMRGGIAVMTMICGLLFTHLQGHLFWVMALVALPALFLRPRAV